MPRVRAGRPSLQSASSRRRRCPKEVNGGRFTIKTNRPGVKVSWQVLGARCEREVFEHTLPLTPFHILGH